METCLLNKVSLSKLSKDEIMEYTLKLQRTIFEKISSFEEKLTKLESELFVSKNVNSHLVTQLEYVKRKCASNEQYSRRECIEIVGLPSSIDNDILEDEVVNLLNEIDVPVSKDSFQACHKLKKKDRIIVKFKNRKDCLLTLKNKKTLNEFDFSSKYNVKKLYINESLCGYYRGLWNKCKKLLNAKLISSFFVSNGNVKIRLNEHGNAITIGHDNDLCKYFPSVDFTTL